MQVSQIVLFYNNVTLHMGKHVKYKIEDKQT